MRKLLPSLVLFTLSLLLDQSVKSQITIPSDNGSYTVTLNVRPTALVPATTNCQWGYNYNVRLSYVVTFGGVHPPSSLYMLQGTVGCDNNVSNFFQLPVQGGSGNMMTTSNQWSSRSDCQTATISSMNCRTVTMEFSGPNMASRSVVVPQPVVLDVKFNFFEVATRNNEVHLVWGTATETNNDFFSVERSANGSDWSRIGTVKGAGTVSAFNNYNFTDAAAPGGVSYYRIRQVDLDGAATVSEVKTVRVSDASAKVSIFPIPNTGNTITLSGIRDLSNYRLAVMTTAGNQVYQTNLTSASVTLPTIAAGLYFIRITDIKSGEITNIRYIRK